MFIELIYDYEQRALETQAALPGTWANAQKAKACPFPRLSAETRNTPETWQRPCLPVGQQNRQTSCRKPTGCW